MERVLGLEPVFPMVSANSRWPSAWSFSYGRTLLRRDDQGLAVRRHHPHRPRSQRTPPNSLEVRTFDAEELLSVTWSVVDISDNMLPKEIVNVGHVIMNG